MSLLMLFMSLCKRLKMTDYESDYNSDEEDSVEIFEKIANY